MAFNTSYDSAKPVGSDDPKQIHTMIRTNTKEALRERLNVDHDFALDASKTTMDGADVGKHRQVTLSTALSSVPTVAASQGALYGKLVDGQLELFYKSQSGAEKQLTKAGKLSVTAADLAGLYDDATVTLLSDKLAIKDGGVTTAKLAAAVVDNATLEKTADNIRIKDAGVSQSKIAATSVSADKLKLPVKGADSYLDPKVAIMAAGSYQGNGENGRVIAAFAPGVIIRHLVIRHSPGAIEAFSDGSNVLRWNQADGSDGTDLGFNNNHTFTVDAGWNGTGSWYYWFAIGEWNA